MTLADPQTDAELEAAECFVIATRQPGGMFRPSGVTLGTKARDDMLASTDIEAKAIGLEDGSRTAQSIPGAPLTAEQFIRLEIVKTMISASIPLTGESPHTVDQIVDFVLRGSIAHHASRHAAQSELNP